MIIERTENNKIVITMSSDVDIFKVQQLINYGRYQTIYGPTSRS